MPHIPESKLTGCLSCKVRTRILSRIRPSRSRTLRNDDVETCCREADVPEDLIPQTELKEQIHRFAKDNAGMGLQCHMEGFACGSVHSALY